MLSPSPKRRSVLLTLVTVASSLTCLAGGAAAQPSIVTSFDPSEAGGLCGLGLDHTTGFLWVHQCSGSDIQAYSSAGVFQASVGAAGELANDVDVDFSTGSLELDSTVVPAGTLLFINGETNTAEVYALNDQNGNVIDALDTQFGVSHVVGGAHHRGRASLFLVQDRVPGAADENRIAEVDPQTGTVLDSFAIGSVFDVNYGDLDVCPATGHLFVVSSIESRIAELTPEGALVGYHDLPVGVSGLSGIAIGTESDVVWVSGTGGTVWALAGVLADVIFADDFESGDTTRWTSATGLAR